MSTFPGHASEKDVVLRDGSTLLIREARAEDEPELRRFHDELSRTSLYFRFFLVRKSHEAEITRIRNADPADDVVLVGESGGRILAVASYARNRRAPNRADVAFAIADAIQGRGVGTRLLERLAEIARRHEIKFFDADVLGDNTRMMRVFEDSGFVIEQHLDSAVYHVVLSLEDTEHRRDLAASRARTAATASMSHIFVPESIVVVGANRERGKIGSELLHNIVAGGYSGRLSVVHPSAPSIDGVTAYPSLSDVPGSVDLAIVSVPADRVLAVVDACIAKGVKALVVISAGFSEVGPEGRAREADLLRRVRHAGVRLVGPNCMGVINTDPAVRMNATFAPIKPRPGRVALSTQSGALGFAILDYARELNIGFSTFVSVGNKADVSGNDLIQYWAQDRGTDVILLYLESFGNPRKFTEIARRVSRIKPIVAVKAGRSKAGARAASSHTGALAASDAIVEALFRQSGIIRTDTLEELFDVAALLANQPLPRGRRVAVLTNAGGPAILAADTCEAHGLELPALSSRTIAELRAVLPATASLGNPVDMIASAPAGQYEVALGALLRDEHVDAVLVIFIPPLVTQADDVGSAIRRATDANPGKPVLAVCMSTAPMPDALAPVPGYRFPEAAGIALARAAAYGAWRQRDEGHRPRFLDIAEERVRQIAEQALARGGGWLAPEDAADLVSAAGIQVASGAIASGEDAAAQHAARIGYPVVMKAAGPEIVHKTDIGGIRLNLTDEAEVRGAWRDMKGRLGDRMSGALIQQMVSGGVEMLLGVVDDPTFGHVLACATGGTMTEILADRQLRLHPLTDVDADEMIAGLRGAVLLGGYRGSAPVDGRALAQALLRLSALVDICPEIRELDINPLVVLPTGTRAIDVRARLEASSPRPSSRRVSY
jgi:acetyl coenzyme A synthetase (ADP forming)-like protein